MHFSLRIHSQLCENQVASPGPGPGVYGLVHKLKLHLMGKLLQLALMKYPDQEIWLTAEQHNTEWQCLRLHG